MADKLPRTDSTQAMKSIFSAYGDDEEKEENEEEGGGKERDEENEEEEQQQKQQSDGMEFIEDNISGSDDEGSTTRSLL